MNYIAIIIYGIGNFFDSSSKFIYDYYVFSYIDYFSVNLQVMDFNRYYIMKI